MTMRFLIPATVLSAVSVAATSQAAIIALYDFEGGGSGDAFAGQAGLNSSDTEINSTATQLTTGGPEGLDGGGAGNIFNTAQGGADSGPPLANWGNGNNAEGNANYAEFITTPIAGQQITYESLSLFHGSFNTTGQVKITYSFGGNAETNALDPLGHTADGSADLTRADEDFADFTTAEPVTWRIYVFGTDAPNTGTRLDDITINGTLSPVPEPSGWLLSMLGVGLVAVRRRR